MTSTTHADRIEMLVGENDPTGADYLVMLDRDRRFAVLYTQADEAPTFLSTHRAVFDPDGVDEYDLRGSDAAGHDWRLVITVPADADPTTTIATRGDPFADWSHPTTLVAPVEPPC